MNWIHEWVQRLRTQRLFLEVASGELQHKIALKSTEIVARQTVQLHRERQRLLHLTGKTSGLEHLTPDQLAEREARRIGPTLIGPTVHRRLYRYMTDEQVLEIFKRAFNEVQA